MAKRKTIQGNVDGGRLFCDKCGASLGPTQPFPSEVLCRRCNRWVDAWERSYGAPERTPVVAEDTERINHTGKRKRKQMKAIPEGLK